MKNRLLIAFLFVALTLSCFLTGFWVATLPELTRFVRNAPRAQEGNAQIEAFWEVWDVVHERYVDQPVDDEALIAGAIEGMLATLDDQHTRYLTPSEEELSQERMDGSFEGIGAYIEETDAGIAVVSPIEGSPAEAAGLQPGDILMEADGVNLIGMAADQAASFVRGPAGSTVHLVIIREGDEFELDIVRANVQLISARGEMIEGDIAYIRLTQFGFNTDQELDEVLNDLMPQDPAAIVLDLRRNPGGSLDTVVNVADEFLAEGTILIERFGSGREELYRSTDEGLAEEPPMVVLIDEGSASASEVLAGAIRARGRGILVGETSFGKGTVQSVNGLSNGGSVRITIARWLTPNDEWVHDEGLIPDFEIYFEGNAGSDPTEDPQLQGAIDFLRGQPVMVVPQPVQTEN